MSSGGHKTISLDPVSGRTQGGVRQLRRVGFYNADDGDENVFRIFEVSLIISATSTDLDASCAAYASAIGIVSPEIVDDMKQILRRRGIEAVDAFLPSQPDINDNAAFGLNEMLTLFGAGVLLLFKNLNPMNFANFMSARFKALESVVGSTEKVQNPFTLKQAQNVRRVFGSDRNLKKRMVETLIQNAERWDKIGSCCRYVMRILEWSDMQMFKYMYDRVFVCRSSVLDDPKLEGEVAAARPAIDKVMSITDPPFFRFLAPAEDQYLVNISRFPTLISLASAVMVEYYGSAYNFRPPIDVKGPEIRRLLAIYKHSMSIPLEPLDWEPLFLS